MTWPPRLAPLRCSQPWPPRPCHQSHRPRRRRPPTRRPFYSGPPQLSCPKSRRRRDASPPPKSLSTYAQLSRPTQTCPGLTHRERQVKTSSSSSCVQTSGSRRGSHRSCRTPTAVWTRKPPAAPALAARRRGLLPRATAAAASPHSESRRARQRRWRLRLAPTTRSRCLAPRSV